MLIPIELPDFTAAPPPSPKAMRLLEEADRRIDDFVHRRRGPLIHGFVPSDFRMVDACLNWIVKRQLASGHAFCEWGSGFGVITLLAALHDFDACGIEVEELLVEQARQLADDFEISAQFGHGSAIPPGKSRLEKYLVEQSLVDTDSPDAYDEIGLEIDDFDIVFVFPWPGEEGFWERLFHQCASDGALLLTYHGLNDLRLQRRVRG
ncbi:MAG: hypothetical protein U0939_08175 [Pirellulales bacterium]